MDTIVEPQVLWSESFADLTLSKIQFSDGAIKLFIFNCPKDKIPDQVSFNIGESELAPVAIFKADDQGLAMATNFCIMWELDGE